MEIKYKALGFTSLSDYVRHLHHTHQGTLTDTGEQVTTLTDEYEQPRLFRTVGDGRLYHGDSLGLMHHMMEPSSVDLIMTSPPFGLVRKKSYGNEDATAYLKWFRPFAEGFKRVLKPKGSLVIDIGGAWIPGMPVRSLYHFELLVMLCREYKFYLCEEHYWWNPSKLPAPAEWVNIRRVRVKDAVNTIWWLSKTPWPKASNSRVLAPYSQAMEHLLKNGYKPKLRPSGHDISGKFSLRNAGSVPPNLLAVANTESNGAYQTYCKERGLPVHPARYPDLLPEYFIRMLTDAQDVVLDPFAGSCITGEVAKRLDRRWICCETEEAFLEGALGRFQNRTSVVRPSKAYSIFPPCSLPVYDAAPLPADGGAARAEKKPPHAKGKMIPPDSLVKPSSGVIQKKRAAS